MGSKYQIKSKEGIVTFDKKDDFLKKCSFELNETLYKRKRQSDIHYSYDYGNTWNHILNLKNDRQTIQNEKKPQNENMNNSKKSESKLNQSSGVPNWVLIILTPLILLGVYYYANQNNQKVVPNNQNTNSSDGINDEPILNEETTENNFITSIPVTDEALEIYNQSDFLKAIKPTENEKEWILAILSDPNPNPDRNNGNSCSQSNYRCTYCSGFIPSRLYTLQWRLNDILNPSVLTGSSGLGYNFLARLYNEGENDVYEKALQQGYSIIEEVINGYKQGERYTCIREPITNGGQEFCSKECEINNRYSH